MRNLMPRHTTRTRRVLRVSLGALLLTATLATVPSAFSLGSNGPRVVGTLSRLPADVGRALGTNDLKSIVDATVDNGVAIAYPKLDRLYQIYNIAAGPHAGSLAVAERDRGSLTLGRVLIIPDRDAKMANSETGAEWVSTLDTKNDRLILLYGSRGGLAGQGGTVTGNNLPGFLTIDLNSFTFNDVSLPRLLYETADSANAPAGIEYDESTDTLLMLSAGVHGVSALGNTLYLSGWTASQLQTGGELPYSPPRPVRSCRRDPINDATSRYLTPILIAPAPDLEGDGTVKTFVMFPCYATTFSTNVIIARLERSTALDPSSRQERALVAPAGITNWVTGTTHGRMYLTNTSAETDTWVYEAASNAFVGIIAMSPKGQSAAANLSMGVDETSGRLYARSLGYGLMITAAAQDPVPQADIYPDLAAVGSYRILPDEGRDRIFLLAGSSTGAEDTADHYEIVSVPPPLPVPPADDPDQRTTQVHEEPGRTVSQYGGGASGYGLRVLLARGISGAIPSNGNDSAGDVYTNINTHCGFVDRELVLARISTTELSDSSKFAKAAAVDIDSATVTDLKAPSRCDVYNSYGGSFYPLTAVTPFLRNPGLFASLDQTTPEGLAPSGAINEHIGPRTTWDYVPADCTEDRAAGRVAGEDKAGPNSEPLVGDTAVRCDEDDQISATAESRLRSGSSLPVSVSRAVTNTSVKLDQKQGLVSRSEARVENLRIGDITIGYISNSATSYAKGRTGTAKTDFSKPRIGFVNGPGVPSCDQCDLDQVLKSLNTALAGRAEFRRVPPDVAFAAGSPGGYQAGVIKSEKQRASDNSLSGDKSVEIPAFEMIVFNDNAVIGRSRQVIQIAGVRTESHYGIQVIGADQACSSCGTTLGEPDDGSPVLADAPGVALPDVPNLPHDENPITRFFRQALAGALYGLRLIFANPREALTMATVWALLAGPWVAASRRRALLSLNHDHEGSPSA